jgi:EF-P beta-lysylation protein EpmB
VNPSPAPAWRAELAQAFSRVEDLLAYLELPLDGLESARLAAGRFPFRVTRSYAARMAKGDPADPLLRQVLPVSEELAEHAGFAADPVGDLSAMVAPGLLHKYQGRALLITTGACAIHCRYCFRREFPYGEGQLTHGREAEALARIAADPALAEIILSGGDPLVLDDARLGQLIGRIAAISHVRRLRIHSRLPLVLPARATPALAALLQDTRLDVALVVHANHAQELNAETARALARLRAAGVMLLNQSVLLQGVNDTLGALADLSEALFSQGVLPYYLHLLDRAQGTAHFEVGEAQARRLHEALRRRLPGYLVPRLAREDSGAPYKTLLSPAW